MKNELKVFEDSNIRSIYDEEKEKWFFSVVDIIAVLTESPEPRKYWSVLKTRLKKEGSELTTICSQLKMKASDGKFYNTDALDVEGCLRLVQSVPSPKAEPVKQWLAKVGYERMKEMADPSLVIDRARNIYKDQGCSDKWIQQRFSGQQTRNNLTDYWGDHGIEQPSEYAILTNIIHKEWSGLSVKEHKNLKGLKKENLRDNMSDLELVLTMLAEATTTELSKTTNPQNFQENVEVAKKGGNIAGDTRKAIEESTGKPVITSKNAAELNTVVTNLIEGIAEDADDEK